MKKITVIVILALTVSIAQSQQIPMLSQYAQMPFIYNPAYTGSTGNTNAFLVNHEQWNELPGSPVTRAVTIDGAIQEKKAGLGAVFYNDITDITNRIGAYGSYSYRIKTGEESYLSLGLAVGFFESKIDYSKIIVKDANDLSLFSQSQSKTTFDGNAGVLFSYKKLKIGVSVPQLLGNKVTYIDSHTHSVYQMSRHYLASVKYSFDLSKQQNIGCTPLILVRYIPTAPIQYDINASFDWKKIVGIGITYKSNYAVAANVFFKIHQSFTVGYAYDFITSNINAYAGTSHELLLGYTFGVKKKKELEQLQADVEDLKKNSSDDTELKKQVESDKELLIQHTAKLDSLQKEIDKLKANMPKTSGNTETKDKGNNGGADASSNKTDDTKNTDMTGNNGSSKLLKIGTDGGDGIRIISKKDFVDDSGKPIKVGYYVVVGTFYYFHYATGFVETFKAKGYPNASYIYYSPLHYHYVFIDYVMSKEESLKLLKKVKVEQSDACVLLNVID